mmetsp:Transcript_21902/g.30466  ORF Transcript_21902/g.30466 Transcript_21902/m.30466 type:complete len:188 (+) Transcript_21902:157-720(+)|eukprot:CAMPEP_0196582590 /NCGR_PEP_ID=MMETSP1081-20130531/39641_1 /TAXON_ID=36882 /ORGANISM="Pyramimonas amylifera, Strain CCMP720" /LENGTH=187 /DNA_ID=CAMNT_0041903203 /DNA_START=139 /DNA_END=702 /DNA_ORIENTATION=+
MPPARIPTGPVTFSPVEKINAELFTLTYGSIVRQLLIDYEDNVESVNVQLEKMGYNIGVRLIDEFLAKSSCSRCNDFRETADVIAKVGLKMFLGVSASVTNWNAEGTECSLVMEDNPMVDFVELPEQYKNLSYCNMLCGVFRGALEMVNMKVESTCVRDMLRGHDAYEFRLRLLEVLQDEYPFKDDE